MPSKYFYSKESPHFFEDTEWTPFEEAEELERKAKCWDKLKSIDTYLLTALDVPVSYEQGFNHAINYYKEQIRSIEKEQIK